MSLTRVYQYIQADPNGLRHVWRDKSTGTYIAAFKTKEAALAYRDFHRRDGNKWVVPSERVSQQGEEKVMKIGNLENDTINEPLRS